MSVIQPMPELTPDQFDSLRADIATNGVLVPIVKDQHGRILDGNHRAIIAAELGIDYPTVTVIVADDADAWDKAVTLNCARRHLSREQRRDLIEDEIRRRPSDSDRAIARRVGCSPTTVGAVRAETLDPMNLTRRIAKQIDVMRGNVFMAAVYAHNDGASWQAVGNALEQEAAAALSLGNEPAIFAPVWAAVFAPMFDSIRECAAQCTCQACNGQAVSNLDTTEAVVT